MAQKILIGKVISDGEPVSDVAVKIKDRPCYISGRDGTFEYLVPEEGFTIEKIERPGYRLVSPALPFTSKGNEPPVAILMKQDESFSQRLLRKKGEALIEEMGQCDYERRYGDAADKFIERANLDPDNVRWQYEAGRYMHMHKDYKTAQALYNRAIKKRRNFMAKRTSGWLIAMKPTVTTISHGTSIMNPAWGTRTTPSTLPMPKPIINRPAISGTHCWVK